jgi:hypothetical protein
MKFTITGQENGDFLMQVINRGDHMCKFVLWFYTC